MPKKAKFNIWAIAKKKKKVTGTDSNASEMWLVTFLENANRHVRPVRLGYMQYAN